MPITKLTPTAFEDNVKFRNLIINGNMSIAQRGTSATAVSGLGVYNTIDRISLWENTDGAYTSEQSTDVPSGQGFSNSIKLAVTTADTSIGASQYSTFGQIVEAQNAQYLKYGTANAETLTVSFWVKSSKTGTYSIALEKSDSTVYRFVKEYTINTANTWEKKTIKIEPDNNIKASGGAIANDNGVGLRLLWNLVWGSDFTGATDNTWVVVADNDYWVTGNEVNWMDSTSNDFYLTGVQLEAGEVATPFEFLPYDVNLQRCLRYFERYDSTINDNSGGVPQGIATVDGTNRAEINLFYTRKRGYPTITGSSDVTIGTMANTNLTGTSGPNTYVGTGLYGANLFYGATGISVNSLSGINYIILTTGKYINIDAEL